VIGVEEIPPSDTKSYGIVDGKEWEESIVKMAAIVARITAKCCVAAVKLGLNEGKRNQPCSSAHLARIAWIKAQQGI
jgi:hypothetical protein